MRMFVYVYVRFVTVMHNVSSKRYSLLRGDIAHKFFSLSALAVKRTSALSASSHLKYPALCQQPFPEISFPVLPAGSGLCRGAPAPRRLRRGSCRPGRATGLLVRPPAPACRRACRLLRLKVAPKGARALNVRKLTKSEPLTSEAGKPVNKSPDVCASVQQLLPPYG